MKLFVIASFIAACASSPAPTKSAPPATFACGDTSCTDAQICITSSFGPGTPPPDGDAHISISYECAATPRTGSGFGCSMVDAHHQTCEALIPAAPRG